MDLPNNSYSMTDEQRTYPASSIYKLWTIATKIYLNVFGQAWNLSKIKQIVWVVLFTQTSPIHLFVTKVNMSNLNGGLLLKTVYLILITNPFFNY